MIVYCIRNRINGKPYIGKTVKSLRKRWIQHLFDARAGSRLPIHRAIRKYGERNFLVVKLYECPSPEELNHREKKAIEVFRSHITTGGYNVTWGGDGTESGEKSPAFGTKRTLRVRKILSEGKIGDKNPSRKAAGPSHWNRGLVRSEETKSKIRIARAKQVNTNRGMRHSEETRAKIRAARARQVITPAMLAALELGRKIKRDHD